VKNYALSKLKEKVLLIANVQMVVEACELRSAKSGIAYTAAVGAHASS